MNDGRELKYRTKKVDVKQLNLNIKITNVNIWEETSILYYIVYSVYLLLAHLVFMAEI